VFHMNYFYVGGASRWEMADPAFSPIRPGDPPTWTLMVDMVHKPSESEQFLYTAHKERNGSPAGANHLFNDLHVDWVKWNGGRNMRTKLL